METILVKRDNREALKTPERVLVTRSMSQSRWKETIEYLKTIQGIVDNNSIQDTQSPKK